jgi:hypothetical protein
MDGRRIEAEDWSKHVDAPRAAALAPQEKNVDKVLDVGNQIYEACKKRYLPAAKTGG